MSDGARVTPTTPPVERSPQREPQAVPGVTHSAAVVISIGPDVARATGIGLTVYGVLGIVLIVVALLVGGAAFDRVERLSGSLDGTLSAAASTARTSTSALGNLHGGVTQSSTAADDAGRLVDQAAATSAQLSAAMSASILGAQPLLPMASSFNDLSTQLRSLSGDLRSIGSALDTSGSDLSRLEADMRQLTARLDTLTGPNGSASVISDGGLRLALLALLSLMAIPAIGALLVGLALLGFLRRPMRAVA